MIPVDQDIFGGGKGNCWAACLATLLDKPLSEVPNFCGEMGDAWWEETQSWLQGQGLYGIEVFLAGDGPWLMSLPPVPVILTGKSPRGEFGHACVGRISGNDIEFIHDPHPSREFLGGKPERLFFLGWLGVLK